MIEIISTLQLLLLLYVYLKEDDIRTTRIILCIMLAMGIVINVIQMKTDIVKNHIEQMNDVEGE